MIWKNWAVILGVNEGTYSGVCVCVYEFLKTPLKILFAKVKQFKDLNQFKVFLLHNFCQRLDDINSWGWRKNWWFRRFMSTRRFATGRYNL